MDNFRKSMRRTLDYPNAFIIIYVGEKMRDPLFERGTAFMDSKMGSEQNLDPKLNNITITIYEYASNITGNWSTHNGGMRYTVKMVIFILHGWMKLCNDRKLKHPKHLLLAIYIRSSSNSTISHHS